ncbi:MAG TPA: electron transfer flavoprotein subunit alpha/FixB family protein [Pseudonocardiaceae bacterium]
MSRDSWVVVGGHPGIANLIGTAHGLGGTVRAVVIGPPSLALRAATAGVDQVVWLGEPVDAPVEAYAKAAGEVVAAQPGVVFVGRRPAERVLAGAVAAALGAPVLTDVRSVAADGEQIVVTHSTYNGAAQQTVAHAGPVVLVIDGGGIPAQASGAAPVTETLTQPRQGITVLETTPPAFAAADLSSATRVIGVGRGLRCKEDLPLVESLADAAKAELACSRPLAEGLNWLGRDRYLGISGQQIAPELYLAVGLSGQLQHMAGVRGAKVIVSVNSDPDAPIVAEADYVLVGDLYELVPAITAALR